MQQAGLKSAEDALLVANQLWASDLRHGNVVTNLCRFCA
jgi:hypothetical protein